MSETDQEILTPETSSQESSAHSSSNQEAASQEASQAKSSADDDLPYTEEQRKTVAEMEAGPMKAELKYLDKRKSDKGKTYYIETKDGELTKVH